MNRKMIGEAIYRGIENKIQ